MMSLNWQNTEEGYHLENQKKLQGLMCNDPCGRMPEERKWNNCCADRFTQNSKGLKLLSELAVITPLYFRYLVLILLIVILKY